MTQARKAQLITPKVASWLAAVTVIAALLLVLFVVLPASDDEDLGYSLLVFVGLPLLVIGLWAWDRLVLHERCPACGERMRRSANVCGNCRTPRAA